MKAAIAVLTLGVTDLERAVQFYRDGLGWKTNGITGREFPYGAVAYFDLQQGLKLALWPRKSISFDTKIPPGTPDATALVLVHYVAHETEIGSILEKVIAAGGHVIKPVTDNFWKGSATYFQDPDGHLWEVAVAPEAAAFTRCDQD
jgi:uncharacterized protein